MPDHRVRRRLLNVALPAAIAAIAVALAAPASAQTATDRKGRIVEAPGNITDFAPDGVEHEVDAWSVNLTRVLEDLGPTALSWYQHATTLADPFFEGRVASTRGMEFAGEYIAFYFKSYGLQPAFPGPAPAPAPGGAAGGPDEAWTSYFQPFDINVREGPRVAAVKEARCAIGDRELEHEKDFVVFGNSGSGEVTAPVTFVGYGIEDGPDGYSSFSGDVDLKGRIALVLRYEPLKDDGSSRWSDDGFSRNASLRTKLRRLADKGASGIIVVNPPGAAEAREGLDSIERSSQFGAPLAVPVVQFTEALAGDLLIQADPKSRDLMTLRRLADEGAIEPLELSKTHQVTISAQVQHDVQTRAVAARNVGGVLRGRGAHADEWLVITGHYDHVGMGQLSGAMAGNRGKVHPGADDNASGTAGVMVMARLLSEAYAEAPADADLRSVLFLAVDGEEQGLLGSRHYVDHPTVDPTRITADINFDMIGSLRNDHLMVLGAQTAEGLEDLLKPHIEASGLTVALSPASSGRSDEANFIRIGVPGLHFFTGMTPNYHRPSDEYYQVNPGGAAKVIALAYDIAWDMVTRADRLAFTEPGRARTEGRGYGPVRLGVRPGMGEGLETGVLVEGVSLDTSAAEAGIQEGDIILSWNGAEMTGVRDLFENLQKHKPGDIVKLEIKRGEEVLTLEVKLKGGEGQ